MENMIPKKDFNFNDLVKLKYTAPWKPKLKSKSDHSNFDPYDEGDQVRPYIGTQFEDKVAGTKTSRRQFINSYYYWCIIIIIQSFKMFYTRM